jgi:hypothetical protein
MASHRAAVGKVVKSIQISLFCSYSLFMVDPLGRTSTNHKLDRNHNSVYVRCAKNKQIIYPTVKSV